ncbi:hypothetical protein PLESTB_001243000 [Pleodorina starrii]|uniref:Uncharacterized protein n=1 Tax=Pleodorina starrii TaxID=330485 RepID=A0A9W6F5T2_9CHLO|nr:hypothetical protein PLESTB_001243000 [Pleodorina starrii]GLC63253.1 hypothetical protein PLESTF_000016800 [Pleodorina starrii]
MHTQTCASGLTAASGTQEAMVRQHQQAGTGVPTPAVAPAARGDQAAAATPATAADAPTDDLPARETAGGHLASHGGSGHTFRGSAGHSTAWHGQCWSARRPSGVCLGGGRHTCRPSGACLD